MQSVIKLCGEQGVYMVEMKYVFVVICVLALAFVAFMATSSGTGARSSVPSQTGAAGVQAAAPGAGQPAPPSPAVQEVSVHASGSGYDHPSLNVRAGQPVKFDFSADRSAGCGSQLIIDRVGVNLISRNGETVSATFTPPSPGQYPYHCGMNMYRGMLSAS